MSDSGLSAAGSSTYSSNTLHVGDGTWDSQRDTFLLPNLMGVNFETMRYNGMGNRFKNMAGYHSIIIAHGVIATIVFLGLVPISTLIIRYYSRWNPFWAFKLHAWCQVLTLLLTTVVFVLGWFAVGPERSLTNPHHGIGLAIYVMVIFQVLWGWFLHKVESKKRSYHVPLKLVIHRWLGRALAILGIVQIPLGLTLYGSPKVLFILFAVAAFALFMAFFVLSYLYDDEGFHAPSEHGSRYTGPSVVEEEHGHHGGLGQALAGGALGAGLASMFRRRQRSRHSSQVYEESRTSYSDDKYSDESSRPSGGGGGGKSGGGWGKKLLEIGALAGAGILAKKLWDRRRNREDDAESGRYRPAHSRSDSYTEDSLSRLEDGRPEPARPLPANRPPSRPPSRPQSPGSSYYYNSTYLTEPERRPSHGVRDALLGAGAFAAVKRLFSRNKDKDDEEKRRMEDIRRREEEDERLQRANSKRRRPDAGVGPYPQRRRPSSYTESDLTPTDLTPRPPPPRQSSLGDSLLTPEPVATGAVHGVPSDIPPIPPVHQELSGDLPSERPHSYHSHHSRHSHDFAEGALAGAAAGAAMGAASSHRRSSVSRHREDHVESPPVSVKVKMHNDGRHVTLRRLTEEEAAAQREARRRERRNSRRRGSSAGSLSGDENRSQDRWRRVEEMERRQAEQTRREQEAAIAAASAAPTGSAPISSFHPSQSQISHMPPPPPIPQPAPSSIPYGSVTSPGIWTGTDASGSYANNRRRRRAERARARQERQQRGVEFE
ncbi:hypothetical protein N7462_002985 [Penicillium macrosclerotiorum]|uniref:uncharacterized protein n=1 Tax=Penicillium macrosclerotiorum TaxID=303699 RepID=UPI002548D546|nr:uncharacterized protein N7462_002985 [Penicillium macrosclerotiorum]KAJ5688593.1 hypothetical protein N7462_002985 [Penicillium macrosclerotiorum]